jgi:hypothetical protein
MKPRDVHIEILWQLIGTAAWLHDATVMLTLSKWTGFLQVSWTVAFLPSLLYGALVLLIGASGTMLAWGKPISRRRVPVIASSSQRS